jgi:hypothetical protein
MTISEKSSVAIHPMNGSRHHAAPLRRVAHKPAQSRGKAMLTPLVGVQIRVQVDALTVPGHHLDGAAQRIAAEQQVAVAGQFTGLD